MSEPKLALDSILENEETKQPFHPVTIARYALLTLIDSPFFKTNTSPEDFSIINILPTWYVMTADTKDLRKYDSRNVDELKECAFDKADKITDPNELREFTESFVKYLTDLMKIAPDAQADDDKTKQHGKKVPTAS